MTLPSDAECVTAAEVAAGMNLYSEHPVLDAAPTAPPSPAVNSLVSRFSGSSPAPTPAKVPEASLLTAIAHCPLEILSGGLVAAAAMIEAPETLGLSLLSFVKVASSGSVLGHCIDNDYQQQLAEQSRRAAIAACDDKGGTALNGADGSLVCLVTK
jgi:hypothetical protein